jgi:hypothetical protein
MTFTIPGELAAQFVRRVPSRDRSRYVSEAICAKLREREDQLIQSCAVANRSSDVRRIEREWEAITDTDAIEEPWTNAPSR